MSESSGAAAEVNSRDSEGGSSAPMDAVGSAAPMVNVVPHVMFAELKFQVAVSGLDTPG
jgi:hypothetical protein